MRLPDRAMVLAAGRGERMRPLTDTMPKPLVPVAGKPLIDYTLDALADAGVMQVVVNTSYLAEQLQTHLQRRQRPSVTLSHEPERLETGGGIAKALPMLGDAPFFSFNSDIILRDAPSKALRSMAEAWQDDAMDVLMLLVPIDNAQGYEAKGDFFYEEGMLRRRGDADSAPYVFSGVQLMHPRLFIDAPEGAFSLNILYDRQRDNAGKIPNIKAVIYDGLWLHVGTPDQREQAESFLAVSRQAHQ